MVSSNPLKYFFIVHLFGTVDVNIFFDNFGTNLRVLYFFIYFEDIQSPTVRFKPLMISQNNPIVLLGAQGPSSKGYQVIFCCTILVENIELWRLLNK